MRDEHNTVCGELPVTQQVSKYLEQKERLVRISDTISKLSELPSTFRVEAN